MAGGGAEDSPEPLQYQTMVLKVSIHCEGCRKKVKKVLQNIEGVYKTTIDAHNHKVTVTGNVEADTLVKRLLKTGKHAELWPSPEHTKPNNNNNNNNSSGKKKSKAAATQSPSLSSGNDDAVEKHADAAEDDVNDGGKEAEKPNGTPAPQLEKTASEATATAGGGGGKKKGKRGQSNNGGGDGGGGGEAAAGKQEGGKAAALPPAGGLPPRPQSYNFPAYNSVTPPAYVLSYSTAQPSYGSAGYFPVQRSSYVYPHPGSYYIPPPAVVDDDTFRIESSDVCGIM